MKKTLAFLLSLCMMLSLVPAPVFADEAEGAQPEQTVVIPQEAKDVFDKAAGNLDGNELEPMALLGTQVVAGTNYAFLCFSTLQTEETINGIQVVTVYEDLDGNAEITNICTVDPADYNE